MKRVKGSWCANCKEYFGKMVEVWRSTRCEEWVYSRCTNCNHEWDSFGWTPTIGCSLDDLRQDLSVPDPDPYPYHYYLKKTKSQKDLQ